MFSGGSTPARSAASLQSSQLADVICEFLWQHSLGPAHKVADLKNRQMAANLSHMKQRTQNAVIAAGGQHTASLSSSLQ